MGENISEKAKRTSAESTFSGDTVVTEGKQSEWSTASIAKLNPGPDVNRTGEDEFGHLPPHEAAILRRQVIVPKTPVSVRTLYRYATSLDLLIIAISAICAIAGGAALPLMTVWIQKMSFSGHG